MKKRWILVGVLVLAAFVLFAGGQADKKEAEGSPAIAVKLSPEEVKWFSVGDKKPEEITGKLLFWTWDEAEFAMMKSMNSIYPNVTFEFVNVSYGDYIMKVQAALASGSDVPDVLTMDIINLAKFFSMDIAADIGSAPYNIDKGKMIPYLANLASDEKGILRAVPNIPCPSAFFYRRDLAKQYFGTDDPAEIGKKIKDWDGFINTGKELAAKSGGKVFMIAGVDTMSYPIVQLQTNKPWVEGKKLLIAENYLDRFQLMERVRDAKIDAGLEFETPAFNASFAKGNVFGYFGVMWFQRYIVEANDPEGKGKWAITDVPEKPYSWGGIYWGMHKNAKNKDAAAAYLKYQLSMRGAKAKWELLHYIPVYAPAYEDTYFFQPNEYLAGQDTTRFYLQVMKKMQVRKPNLDDHVFLDLTNFYAKAIAKGTKTAREAVREIEDEMISKFPGYSR